jgi:hypothetical protein
MTALLRVDLQNLPKKMTRLIVITDRPLTGTFETSFDPSDKTTYPEIVSPVSNDKAKESYTFNVDRDGDGTIAAADAYNDLYFLAIGTESVSERTNKTFFIPVPTGNKYKTFDVLVEYNMGSLKKYEIVTQLGADHYGKVLKWERGKVKSLNKEITVTASGNTPKLLSQFLKEEWKSFPAGADINITVADASGDLAPIDNSGTVDDRTFTIPAELKGTVNIIVDPSVGEGYTATATKALIIVDEDKAPVASDPLRKINFCVASSAKKPQVLIDAPESQISLTAPEGETAEYNSIGSSGDYLTASYGDDEEAGLYIGEGVTTGSIFIKDGSMECEATQTNKIINEGDYPVVINGGTHGDITSNGDGLLIVTGPEDKSTTIGEITAKGAGSVVISNVADVTMNDAEICDEFTGEVVISNVAKLTHLNLKDNVEHANAIIIKDVDDLGKVEYKGLGAVTIDNVTGSGTSSWIVQNNEDSKAAFTVTNLQGTLSSVKYNGDGAVDIEGKAGVAAPTITKIEPKGEGAVTLKHLANAGTGETNTGLGALVIEDCDLQTVTNDGGTISATGVTTGGKSIKELIQNGAGKITLTNMYDVTTLTLGASADVDYENTYIGTFAAGGYTTTATGTKASGIGTATGTTAFTPKTDVWDGSVCPTQTTGAVYTSASLAALCGTAATTATLYLDLDMGGTLNFQDDAAIPNKGIADAVGTFVGGGYTISNLKAETGLFADRTATLTASNFTIKNPVITKTANAGAFVGVAGNTLTLTSVNVENATIASESKGYGTDINLGGMIGAVNATGKTIQLKGCNVATASIKGHYYMGGFIGQILDAKEVFILDVNGQKIDKKGSTVSGLTFTPISEKGDWSTLKCGTIAPFIGGIKKMSPKSASGMLRIYGKFDSFNRKANKWNMNFLSNETYKFIGTKQDDCNFVGYIDVANITPGDAFIFHLKNLNGFEADTSTGMTILTDTDTGKPVDSILATECNAYAENYEDYAD